jgi:peptidoglycan/LPS O-acetylase OafA/YrhL
MQYRREVDGLRALAVLPVILFHAGFEAFSGGFVGVDVFFVISGFLITGVIVADLGAGEFSIARFYERRARRILPALFLVMLACLPAAWLWLLPQEMQDFSASMVAVSTFVSNMLFWRTSGYFDSAAELKPMLHTWSLAVEEQYYVLFPVLLAFMWRFGRSRIQAMFAIFLVCSLAASQWASVAKPSADFYLLPTRGWELLLGGSAALHVATHGDVAASRWVKEAAAMLGLALIVYAVFAFTRRTPFPSLYALVPTVGAVLIILCADARTFVGRLLGSRILVGVGLISYSAYLWHQPLFAFARQREMLEPAPAVLALLASLSLLLAYLGWKYVESPFRDSKRVSRRRIFTFALGGSTLFIVIGIAGLASNGFEWRVGTSQAAFLAEFRNDVPAWNYFTRVGVPGQFAFECDFYDISKYRGGHASQAPVATIAPACHVRDAHFAHAVFIWGDSHAQMLRPGLMRYIPADWQVLQVASSGCAPQLDATPSNEDYCRQSNWFAYDAIKRTRPDVVLVAQNLGHDAARMKDIGDRLLAAGVRKVVFTGPSPHWGVPLPNIVALKLWPDVPRHTHKGLDPDVLHLDRALEAEFLQSPSQRYVSLIADLCDVSGCRVFFGDRPGDGITSWDTGHLTPVASADVAKNVLVREIVAGL